MIGLRALQVLADDAVDRGIQRHRLTLQLHAAMRQPRAVQDLADHRGHARQIREHAVHQGARMFRRQLPQAHGLERQLQTGERRLELVRHQRQELFLFIQHAGLGAQRHEDRADAGEQREQEEPAFPQILRQAPMLFIQQRRLTLRREHRLSALTYRSGNNARTRSTDMPAASMVRAAARCWS